MRMLLSSLLQQTLHNKQLYSIAMQTLSRFEQLHELITTYLPFTKKNQPVDKNQELCTTQRSFDKFKSQSENSKINGNKQLTNQDLQSKQTLSQAEIQELAANIRSLNRNELIGILSIMKSIGDQHNQKESKQLQFDVGQIPYEKQKELQKYVIKCQKLKLNMNQSKPFKQSSKSNSIRSASSSSSSSSSSDDENFKKLSRLKKN